MAELILQEEKIIFSVKVLAQWALYEKKKKKKKGRHLFHILQRQKFRTD